MSPTVSTKKMVAMDDIIVIGFENNFEDYLTKYSRFESDYRIRAFESSFVAFRWIERNLNHGNLQKLPKAIVCNLSFLLEDDFRFAHSLQTYPVLNEIPFFVASLEPLNNTEEILKYDIDDFYEIPISFEDLEMKINFLSKYKSLILEEKKKTSEEKLPEFKIPFLKRVFDVVVASIAILLLSPIWLLIALAIRLESKGPIIYRSQRVGTGYRVFDFLKFRSMYPDADKRLKEYEHLNQYSDKEDSVFKKISNDPRVTKVGRIIRKISFDEMPQLLNVLMGDMSVVGNRPLPLYEAELLTKDDWARRFLAPAGCTGLWQISKRGKANMSTEERINLDVTYAKNYSFWYDLKIMLKTIPALIQEENV